MLERVVDPAELVGQILNIKPYEDYSSAIYKDEVGKYELVVRIDSQNILGIPVSSQSHQEKSKLYQGIFSKCNFSARKRLNSS